MARSVERGGTLALDAVPVYSGRPDQAANVSIPRFIRTGVVSRVIWTSPDNRVSVGVRSLTT